MLTSLANIFTMEQAIINVLGHNILICQPIKKNNCSEFVVDFLRFSGCKMIRGESYGTWFMAAGISLFGVISERKKFVGHCLKSW